MKEVKIESLVHGYVRELVPMMAGLTQSYIDSPIGKSLVPSDSSFRNDIAIELSIAAVAHSIALTPDPLVARERIRWVSSHRQCLESILDRQGAKGSDDVLKEYLEAHDSVMTTWTNPLTRALKNRNYKFPMRHILEVFPVVAYDRLGIEHDEGEFAEYPLVKDATFIDYWSGVLSKLSNSYWNGAFRQCAVV